MPRTPEQNEAMLLQIAYDLGQKNQNREIGPMGQMFTDFLKVASKDGTQTLKQEEARQKETRNDLEKRPKNERSRTRGQRLERMASYQHGFLIKLKTLGDALHAGDYVRAKKMLPIVAKEMDHFSSDYDQLKKAMPELFTDEIAYAAFDRLMTGEERFPLGEQLQDRLDGKNLDRPLVIPATPKKFVLEERKYEPNEVVPTLQINEEIYETRRQKDQLYATRQHHNVFEPNVDTYDSVLGECMHNIGEDGESADELLARALAAARLRKQGVPYDKKVLADEADKIETSPAFPVMTSHRGFVLDTLKKPLKIDRALTIYEQESKYIQSVPKGPKNYSEYLRLHTWPNVPEGKEKEYLAKCISATRLQRIKMPFDLETIRKDAADIQKQYSFREMTTEQFGPEEPDARVRRWLHSDEIVVADITLQDKRNTRIIENSKEPQDQNQKSWAGYRRMHTQQNVPVNASDKEKRMYLAKAMVAVRGMAGDKPFSVKAARKAAEVLAKNPHFRAITKDPQRVNEALASGEVSGLFDEMLEARKRALQAKQKPSERILDEQISLGESGLETQTESPREREQTSALTI